MEDIDSTEYKIKVMQAHLDGKEIEFSAKTETKWMNLIEPVWNWSLCDYRIKTESKKVYFALLVDSVGNPVLSGVFLNEKSFQRFLNEFSFDRIVKTYEQEL